MPHSSMGSQRLQVNHSTSEHDGSPSLVVSHDDSCSGVQVLLERTAAPSLGDGLLPAITRAACRAVTVLLPVVTWRTAMTDYSRRER